MTTTLHDSTTGYSLPASRSAQLNVGRNERIASLAGGTLLAAVGASMRGSLLARIALVATGAPLIWRGLTGHSRVNEMLGRDTARGTRSPLRCHVTMTVQQSRDEVYRRWRRFDEFPRFMKHVAEVRDEGETSHWVAPLPGGMGSIEWDAELKIDEPGERIAWSSKPGSVVDNAGEIRFEDAPGGRGTEIHATIWYRVPQGDVGRIAAKLLDPVFEQMVEEDIRRFKNLVEADEMPTTEGQPTGGRR